MNMMEANKMKVLAKEEMKQYRELTGLADYYKKKSEEDPDNRMNDHWFNFYNDRVVVFVVDPKTSTVEERKVELGAIDLDGNIQITSGLKPDETVVTAGTRYLNDGQKVKEIQPTSKANVGGLL